MKIDDYDIKGVPAEIKRFAEDITILLNNGKYSHPVIPSNPSWNANNGELVLVRAGSSTRIGFFVSNTWNLVDFSSQVVRAWITFSGTNGGAILSSVNVSSFTRDREGEFTIVWANSFATTNYAVSGICNDSGGFIRVGIMNTANNPTSQSLRIRCDKGTGQDADPTIASVIATGVI